MDDQQIDSDVRFSSIIAHNRIKTVFSESQFGPWRTNRQLFPSRYSKSLQKQAAKPTIEAKPKIQKSLTVANGKRCKQSLKIKQSQLQLSILLLQPRLPSIRILKKIEQSNQTEMSSFCLPVKNCWQVSSIKNLSRERAQSSRKSLMKQLNFIRKNKRQFIKRTLRRVQPLKNKNSVKLQSLNIQL